MSFDRTHASLLASASQVIYQNQADLPSWAILQGMSADFFSKGDTQGCIATNTNTVLLAFRGTESKNIRDWTTDAQAVRVPSSVGGSVHRGFDRALDAVWSDITQTLQKHAKKRLLITGHSLGGALAVLAASRLPGVPLSVYTYGQPRVGSEEFAKSCEGLFGSDYFRFVNDKDIVPRVPPFTSGYRHFGHEIEIATDGMLREVDFGIETLEDAVRLAAGSAVGIPKAVSGFVPTILDIVDSVARGKNSSKAALRAFDGLLAFAKLIPGGGVVPFLQSLKDRTTALAAIQKSPGVLEPIADHDIALYRKAFDV